MSQYAVVRMNSTSGPYVIEISSPSRRAQSIADIAWWGTNKKQAQDVADKLNKEEEEGKEAEDN